MLKVTLNMVYTKKEYLKKQLILNMKNYQLKNKNSRTKKANDEMAKLDKLQTRYELEMEALKPNSLPYKRRQKYLDKSDFIYSY